jgi:2-phospho-L-lactate guanylyltransferase
MVAAIVSDLPALQATELDAVLASAGRRRESVYATDLAGVRVTFQAERTAKFEARLALDLTRRRRPWAPELQNTPPGLRCDVDTCVAIRIAAFMGVGEATQRELDGELGERVLRQAAVYEQR